MEKTRSSPGAAVPIGKERVLRAAVELADREGLESCAMRRVADELGVAVMSLYYYVSSKGELLDGMVDTVFSEIALPSCEGDWKLAMRDRAISTREALTRHPWAVGLMESRMTPGPASLRVHDAVLGCLREAGFSIEMTVHAYSTLDAYIYGFALQERSAPFETAQESAAVAEEQVREFAELAEERHFGTLAEEFPYLAEVVGGHVAHVGVDFAAEFEYGLDLILDALEPLRDSAGNGRSPSSSSQ